MPKAAPVLVEYIGDAPGDLSIWWRGRPRMKFAPKPEYDDRRVERFSSEQEAQRLMRQYNKPGSKDNFIFAEDLISTEDRDATIRAFEESDLFASLHERIGRLETEVAALKERKKPGPKPKAPAEE